MRYQPLYIQVNGDIASDRLGVKLNDHEERTSEVDHGLHVYIDTRVHYANFNRPCLWVNVSAEPDDLIAVDRISHEAVFLKVKVKKEDLVHPLFRIIKEKRRLMEDGQTNWGRFGPMAMAKNIIDEHWDQENVIVEKSIREYMCM